MELANRRGFLRSSMITAGVIWSGGGLRALAEERPETAVEGVGEVRKPPTRRFLDAVGAGDRPTVESLLAEDPGLMYARDEQQKSAFGIALLAQHREIGDLLVARGYRPDLHEAALARDWKRFNALAEAAPGLVNQDHPLGGTAMYAAAAGGAGIDMWRVYSYSADPNAAPRGALGATALRVALDFPDLPTAEMTAAALLSNGADPNLAQPGGRSPLHVAALRGSRDLVEFLIRKGAAVDARDVDGRTPRELAESAGQPQVVTMLEREREIPRDHSSSRAAHDASGGAYRAPDLSAYSRIERERIVGASHTKLDVVREAVERHPELAHSMATTTERAVEACAHTGRHDIVDYLLSKGAPCSLPTATMRNDVARVRALLKEDPLRVTERGAHDFALLWYTVIGGGSTEIAELLLQHGAKIERQDWLGTTALHWAAHFGDLDMAALFLEHGADVHRVGRKFDAKGQTPLQLAETPEMAKLLRDHGARG